MKRVVDLAKDTPLDSAGKTLLKAIESQLPKPVAIVTKTVEKVIDLVRDKDHSPER